MVKINKESTKKTVYSCDPNLWVSNYADELFRFAISRLNDTATAEDIVQDTFYSALNALKSFRGDCSEKSWLYNILRNKIIDYYRKTSKSQSSNTIDSETEDQYLSRYFHQSGKYTDHWMSKNGPHEWTEEADSNLQKDEFYEILRKCLTLLSPRASSVFVLKNMDELSSDDICKELNLSSSNYWVLMHRAKLQLRNCLEKNWYITPPKE
ncbi:sigma-70 family RNA polymerase sigma factor [Puteibacter caeruleilacunae]|nr:sigma-70 family RNA polymerase sigma factor [Puteibacter caeruleilacunae]